MSASPRGPVCVTGATGRLGSALVAALRSAGRDARAWSRPGYDLDDPGSARRLVARDNPALVIHAAAWTDVDGCARDPTMARQRNGAAVASLAEACAGAGTGLLYVSTNEVFDGRRTDDQGYVETDPTRPINAYGASKLAGEEGARSVFERAGVAAALWIVRTAWLYGPPGRDFPAKILAAASRLGEGEPLRVVADEVGSPTYAVDLAQAIVQLIDAAQPETYHLAGADRASRYEWAADVLTRCQRGTPLVPIRADEFVRPSSPPRWAVLDCSRAAGAGVAMRPWRAAMADYARDVCSS